MTNLILPFLVYLTALDKIFDNMYGNDKFLKLISDFCLKDDYLVKEFIMQIDDKLELLTNKREYLDGYMANYYSDYYLDKVTNEYLDLSLDDSFFAEKQMTDIDGDYYLAIHYYMLHIHS